MIEEWRTVEGFPHYEVSDSGRVRRVVAVPGSRGTKVLRDADNGFGYRHVVLTNEGRSRTRRVHRLVAIAFISNPCGHPDVNHRSGIKADNRAENLEWVTGKQNVRHSFDVLGRVAPRGEQIGNAKLTDHEVLEMRALRVGGSTYAELGNLFGVSENGASAACRGITWGHL